MEEWRAVVGLPYKVSNTGKVFSERTGIIMKPNLIRGGYLQYNLSVGGVRHMRLEHRLVAEAFISNPERFTEINHIDGDKENNTIDNLEWIDRGGNVRHAFANGLYDLNKKRGENNGNSKLSNDQRNSILDDKRTLKEIASQYGVTEQAIWYVKKTWERKEAN